MAAIFEEQSDPMSMLYLSICGKKEQPVTWLSSGCGSSSSSSDGMTTTDTLKANMDRLDKAATSQKAKVSRIEAALYEKNGIKATVAATKDTLESWRTTVDKCNDDRMDELRKGQDA
ncbi:hypothetical protein PG994_013550 [Apiospora phragmitis]|uniref:Uncharacterized protein n=1 Tax=Apiospora phragmitis TaxID=2905665 RepID=A0ABR1T8X9_9PEZI